MKKTQRIYIKIKKEIILVKPFISYKIALFNSFIPPKVELIMKKSSLIMNLHTFYYLFSLLIFRLQKKFFMQSIKRYHDIMIDMDQSD